MDEPLRTVHQPVHSSPIHLGDDVETTAESINLSSLEHQNWNIMHNGTIDVPDSLPKREYYTNLRRFGGAGTIGGRLGSISGASMLGTSGLGNDTLMTVPPMGSPYASGTMGRPAAGRSRTALNFKPSGKLVDCVVVMLDGLEQTFSIDKAAYGQQLFDAVCSHLDLIESDFFGVKYLAPENCMSWLALDQRIDKQIKKNWNFEFQVKFYPYNMESIVEDLTRYYLCLQVRQNLLSGQLPCSFFTYVILSSYVVQSDAGNYDPKQHQGIAYIRDHPFAPQHLQSIEMLHRISENHRLLHGQTPECADMNFLNNAKKLALYGVHMHKVTSPSGVEHGLGVYYGGLLIYLGRIRLHRFAWPRIIKLSYRKRKFIIIVRALDDEQAEKTYEFRCATELMVKRLWNLCVEHHNFFRLRGYERAKKPSVLPGFSSRKYNYNPHISGGGSVGDISPEIVVRQRQQPEIHRLQPQRRQISTPDQVWYTLPQNYHGPYAADSNASQFQRLEQMNGVSASKLPYMSDFGAYSPGPISDSCRGQRIPKFKQTGIPNEMLPSRPVFSPESWRISTADRSRCLGIDDLGIDIAAQKGSDWQGCRANKGVKAPGGYYYEVTVLEDGPICVGWATNDASLNFGQDDLGLMLGTEENSTRAKIKFNLEKIPTNLDVKKGDVVGCYLNFDRATANWYCNGQECSQQLRIPDRLLDDTFLPAVGLKDSRVVVNFGDSPLEFVPASELPLLPLAEVPDDQLFANTNSGWRLNPYDATGGVEVRPDGLAVKSALGEGWQGCRANSGVVGDGRFYYEARLIEPQGLCRVGWATEDGQLILGTDRFGFAYGADNAGFGINGQQGKRMNNNEIDNYGEFFGEGDIIGCFLDLAEGTFKWAKNGHLFGDAYRLPNDYNIALGGADGRRVAFFPSISLVDSTVELNFGDSQFCYFPGPDWTPLSYVPPENVQLSGHMGPKHARRGLSFLRNRLSPEKSPLTKPSTEHREDEIRRDLSPRLRLAGAVPMPCMTGQRPPLTSFNGDENRQQQQFLNESEVRFSPITQTSETFPRPENLMDQMSPTKKLLISAQPLNGVDESITVHRSPPFIHSECYEDKDGKIIKRTTKKTQVVTTKTFHERYVHPSKCLLEVSDEDDGALELAIQEACQLDPGVSVLSTNLNAFQSGAAKRGNIQQSTPQPHIASPAGSQN